MLRWAKIRNFFTWLTGTKKLIFHFIKFFGWGHFLIHDIWKKWPKNDPSQKKFLHPKIRSLIHFNHTKKFQKSMFFPTFIARALRWLRPTIFKAKCLRMVSINSEYLNFSMVEPAPENLAPWLLYCLPSDSSQIAGRFPSDSRQNPVRFLSDSRQMFSQWIFLFK